MLTSPFVAVRSTAAHTRLKLSASEFANCVVEKTNGNQHNCPQTLPVIRRITEVTKTIKRKAN
jgi:hypothetical protein